MSSSRRNFLKQVASGVAIGILPGGLTIRCASPQSAPLPAPEGYIFRNHNYNLSGHHVDWQHYLILGNDAYPILKMTDEQFEKAKTENPLIRDSGKARLTHRVENVPFPINAAQTYRVVAQPNDKPDAVPVFVTSGFWLPDAAVTDALEQLGESNSYGSAHRSLHELEWNKSDSAQTPAQIEDLYNREAANLGFRQMDIARWCLMHHPDLINLDPTKMVIVMSHIDAALARDVERAKEVNMQYPSPGTAGPSLLLLITTLGSARGMLDENGVPTEDPDGLGWAHAYFVKDFDGNKIQNVRYDSATDDVFPEVLANGSPDYMYTYQWNVLIKQALGPLYTEVLSSCHNDPLLEGSVYVSAAIEDGSASGRKMTDSGTSRFGISIDKSGNFVQASDSSQSKADEAPDSKYPDLVVSSTFVLPTDGQWKENVRISLAPIDKKVIEDAVAVTVDNTGNRHVDVWAAFRKPGLAANPAGGDYLKLSECTWRKKDKTDGGTLDKTKAEWVAEYGGTDVLVGDGNWLNSAINGGKWTKEQAEIFAEDSFDDTYITYLGMIGTPPALLGLPIVTNCSAETASSGNCMLSASQTYIVPIPKEASTVTILIGSPASESSRGIVAQHPDKFSKVGMPATIMTGVFEYVIPTMLLALGAEIQSSSADIKEFAEKASSKILKWAIPKLVKAIPAGVKWGIKTGVGKATGTGTKNQGNDTYISIGYSVLGIAMKYGLKKLMVKIAATEAVKAVPGLGEVLEAVSVAAWTAQLAWTTSVIALSEQGTSHDILETATLRVRLFPDRGDVSGDVVNRYPSPSFPQVIFGTQADSGMGPGVVYMRATGPSIQTIDVQGSQKKNGLWIAENDFDVVKGDYKYEFQGEEYAQEYALQDFPKIPRGSTVTINISLQTADGWVAGQCQHSYTVLPGTPGVDTGDGENGIMQVDLAITQCLIPITASTTYQHLGKTNRDENGELAYAITPVATTLVNGSQGVLEGTPGHITLNRPTAQVGYGWRAKNDVMVACGTNDSGAVISQLRNAALPPTGTEQGLSPMTCGQLNDVQVVYDTEASPTGLHFAVKQVISEDGESYYEVRKLNLTQNPKCSDALACNQLDKLDDLPLWGKLRSSKVTKVVVHSAGFLVALNGNGVRLEILDFRQILMAGGVATETLRANSRFVAGPVSAKANGTITPESGDLSKANPKPGQIGRGVSITATPTGKVFLVLDAGLGVVHAFNDMGYPVIDYFTTDNSSAEATSQLTLETGTSNVTYVDITCEWHDLLYVLLFEGSGSTVDDYKLDIYDRKTSQRVTRTSGIVAASLVVDYWRTVYTLNREALVLNTGPEPQVSLWTPSTPDCKALKESGQPAPGCAVDDEGNPTGEPNPVGGC